MVSITPINAGSTQSAPQTFAGRTPVLPNDQPAQSSGVLMQSSVTQSTTSIVSGGGSNSAVTDMSTMLQSISEFLGASGGAGESQAEKTLKLLVAALFLLAILDQAQQGGGQEQSLSQLGNQSSDRSAYVGIFTSSTTVSITQSTMSTTAGYETPSAAPETSQGSASAIDMTA